MWRLSVSIMMVLFGWTVLHAQPNPFELRHRLSVEERQRLAYQDRNPFELIRGEEAAVIRDYLPTAVTPKRVERLEDRRYVQAPGLLFWVYLGLFVVLTFLVSLGRHILGQMTRGMFNDQLTFSLMRDRDRSQASPYFLWYLFFFVNAGIFLYLAVNWYTGSTFPGDSPIYLLHFSGAVAGFYLVKHTILKLIGWIFPLDKPIRQYSFTINLFNALLGLVLFPLNIALTYTSGGLRDLFLYIAFSALVLSYVLRILRGLWIGLPYLLKHPIHFFLYLCAVELAPVLFLWKGILEDSMI